jgi:hypothetical protein
MFEETTRRFRYMRRCGVEVRKSVRTGMKTRPSEPYYTIQRATFHHSAISATIIARW